MMIPNNNRLQRILLILLIILSGYYLGTIIWNELTYLGDIILIFFMAWIVSFIFSPIVHWIQQKFHLKRSIAISFVYLALLGILTGIIAYSVPTLSNEATQIANRISLIASPSNLEQFNHDFIGFLRQFGLSEGDAQKVVDSVGSQARNASSGIVAYLFTNTTNFLSSVATILLDLVIVLLLSFYMMLDGRQVLYRLLRFLPVAWRSNVDIVEDNVSRVFGGFIRGQLIIGFSYGVLTWLALATLGLPNGFLFSFLAGVIMIIPFAGPFLAVIPPVMLVFLESSPQDTLLHALILVVILFVAQQIVMQILAPRIMSQSVGLHPIWIIAALLIGARQAGVWGAFFAAPIAALLAVFIRELHTRWAAGNPLYKEDDIDDSPEASNVELKTPARV
jgi:predicted PurR-regulated permease PerM